MIIDRIEGDLAVCESEGGIKNIPLAAIEGEAREGALLTPLARGRWRADNEAAQKRGEELTARFKSLKKPRPF